MRSLKSLILASALCALMPSVLAAPVASAQQPMTIEVGFSPEGSAKAAVLQTIASAKKTLLLAAYSFTDPDVVRDLVVAKRRGVDVYVLVDEKANVTQGSRPSKSMHGLNTLVSAGIPVATISVYAIHHDKYIVVDGVTVETGSYNYSAAAKERNSENVIVIKNNPELALAYQQHFVSRWKQGVPYKPNY